MNYLSEGISELMEIVRKVKHSHETVGAFVHVPPAETMTKAFESNLEVDHEEILDNIKIELEL